MSERKDEPSPPPSLLSPESRGGDISDGGLEFQMNVLLAYVPGWLAKEGFTSLIREASGDFEAQFFLPSHGYTREFLEVKDHSIAPTEFWGEIDHFRKFDRERNPDFNQFTLVSAGLSKELHPLVNGLRRARSPNSFYAAESQILEVSYADYVGIVEKMGRGKEEADFLFEKVQISPDWAAARNNGRALFREALSRELNAFQDVPGRVIDDAYTALVELLRSSRNKPVTRRDLEAKLQRADTAVLIYSTIENGQAPSRNQLIFDWEKFFGGDQRAYPPAADWQNGLLRELNETKQWILDHRSTRRIILAGNRRLSASIAFGSVFSAVAGFAIDMIGRGDVVWATDAHQVADMPDYALSVHHAPSRDAQVIDLVVSVGIPRDISADVDAGLTAHGLQSAAVLHLHGGSPLVSASQANAVVANIKQQISTQLRETNAKNVHLFIAGPAFLALLLGHRLNAIAPVQCYEWIRRGAYVTTCLLA